MRITQNMTSDNALFNIQQQRSRIDRLNEQVSADMNILRPSDDPITTRQLLDLQNAVTAGDQYKSNIVKGNVWLNMTDTALKGMSDIVNNIRGLVANIAGGTDNTPEGATIRADTITQLKEMRKQLIDMGNTQLGDQYIFGGYKNNVKAFDTTAGTSPPLPAGDPLIGEPTGTFQGTSDKINVDIGRNSTIAINTAGSAVLNGSVSNPSPPPATVAGPYGSTDIIGTLDNLIRDINTNNVTQIQADAAQFDTSSSQINIARSDVANRLKRMESANNMITSDQNTAQGIISDRQNVDFAKAATELTQQQTAFQAALSTTAKISQISLLDYLT